MEIIDDDEIFDRYLNINFKTKNHIYPRHNLEQIKLTTIPRDYKPKERKAYKPREKKVYILRDYKPKEKTLYDRIKSIWIGLKYRQGTSNGWEDFTNFYIFYKKKYKSGYALHRICPLFDYNEKSVIICETPSIHSLIHRRLKCRDVAEIVDKYGYIYGSEVLNFYKEKLRQAMPLKKMKKSATDSFRRF